MAMQVCSNVTVVGARDVRMGDVPSLTPVWSPGGVVRIASRQLSTWFCKPSLGPFHFPVLDYAVEQPSSNARTPQKEHGVGQTPATIHSLPTELLEMVFHHYTHTLALLPYDDPELEKEWMTPRDRFRKAVSVYTNSTTNPIILTHVCGRWRTLARLTPKLWARVSINQPKPHHIPMLATWLQRSQRKPLDLTILQNSDDVNTRNTSAIRDIFYLLLNNACRWRSLKLRLYADTGPLFQSIYEHRIWGPAPLLEEVSFLLLEDWTREESKALSSLLFSSPRLRSIALGNSRDLLDELWAAPLNVITTLTLDRLAAEDLFGLLLACPMLKELSVDTLTRSQGQGCPEISHPSLQRLSLIHMDDGTSLIFDRITLPCLKHLNLAMGYGKMRDLAATSKSLLSLMQRSASYLTGLEIDMGEEREPLLVQLFSSPFLSQLSELSITSTVTDLTMDALTLSLSSPILFPVLRRVSLHHCRVNDGALSRMIISRSGILQYVHAFIHESLVQDASLRLPNMTLDIELYNH
ncbi:hypothetical protein BKA70DRAFT_1561983 [Coprinopsis sp. MPI-PUGE-AT-0042]|nr:hypothetical protein BKA70DRAFT_1561983 [Coprinopsis sp. MPI-PUGE-AT-0042]